MRKAGHAMLHLNLKAMRGWGLMGVRVAHDSAIHPADQLHALSHVFSI